MRNKQFEEDAVLALHWQRAPMRCEYGRNLNGMHNDSIIVDTLE